MAGGACQSPSSDPPTAQAAQKVTVLLLGNERCVSISIVRGSLQNNVIHGGCPGTSGLTSPGRAG